MKDGVHLKIVNLSQNVSITHPVSSGLRSYLCSCRFRIFSFMFNSAPDKEGKKG